MNFESHEIDSRTVSDILQRHVILLQRFNRLTSADHAQARSLAAELKHLMDQNFTKPLDDNEAVIARCQEIQRSLDRMGFLVECQWNLDPKTFQLDTEVRINSPKAVFDGGIN